MYVKIWVTNLVERLRKLTGFRGEYREPPYAMPVLVVNDGKDIVVDSFAGERTASGTTTLVTVPSGRVDTYITGFTLSISASGSSIA